MPFGAYLSFRTQHEAQALVKSMKLGVILDPSGKVDATQPWGSASWFTRYADNVRMTAQATAGDFNVWIPQRYFANLGHPNVGAFTNGAYLSFKTLAEAKANEKTRRGSEC